MADAYFSDYYNQEGKELRGVKNSSLLLSALGGPQQTFDGKDLYPDIFHKAAALMRSLALNHCFHDGNKRTAMMATIIFIEENGYIITAPKKKMYCLAMNIVVNKLSVNNIARTLKNKYCKVPVHKPKSKYVVYRDKIAGWLNSRIDK